MEPLGPVETIELFPGERAALLDLLRGLTPEEWQRPTACAGWSVHDVALHLLGGDLQYLSGARDSYAGADIRNAGDLSDWSTLIAFIDGRNAGWVEATRRLSPEVIVSLLDWTIAPLTAYRATLDLSATGRPVDWAGGGPAPVWLDVAREYTERWVHQQHIREAVAKPGLTERQWSYPVIDAFARALPHALRGARRPEGTAVAFETVGDAAGTWVAVRAGGDWILTSCPPQSISARITTDQETAWKLFTRGLEPEKAAERIAIEGDPGLIAPALRVVGMLV